MIINKTKKIILGSLLALLAFSVIFFCLNSQTAKASDYTLTLATQIESEYNLNTELAMPEAKFVSGDQEFSATESYLIYPDGSAKKGISFKLSSAGVYKLVYTATIDGKFVKQTKSIMVRDALFLTDGSTVTYGTDNPMVNPPTSGAYVQGSTPSYKVDLASGDTLKITKPINLNTLGDSEVLHFFPYNCSNYLNGWGDPANYKHLQNLFYYIKLVDAYDSENYITIRFAYATDGKSMYFCAYGANQDVTGLQLAKSEGSEGAAAPPNKYVKIDEQWYFVRYNHARYGCSLNMHSTSHLSRIPEGNGFRIYYDDTTKEVKIAVGSNKYFVDGVSLDTYLVTDLDNPEIYETKQAFKGFTTGEVTVEISAGSPVSPYDYASFEISTVGGEVVPAENVYVDTNGPEIEIDGYEGGTVKYAVNKEFNVPEATYSDINGVVSTSVIAYYNYSGAQPTVVGIFDGKFTPKRTGEYVIEYKAVDRYGAESVKLLTLECGNYANNEVISFAVGQTTAMDAGQEYTLATPTISSPNGREYYKAYLENVATGNRTEIVNDKIIPVELGAHKIVYEYGDKYLKQTYSYDVQVNSSDNVVFSEIVLPNNFISTKYYTLDPVYATYFTGAEAQTVLADVYVSNDGGEYGATPIDLQDFKVEAESSIKFKFVKNGAYIETPAYDVIKPYDADGNLKIENYFVGDFTKEASNSGILFTANASSGNSSLEFANVVSFKNFSLSLTIPEGKANYNAVKISLIDYYNRDYALELGVIKYGDATKLLCDGYEGPMLKAFEGSSFKLMINYDESKIMETDGLNISFDNNFSSDKIIIKITLEGITGASAIEIQALNNQPITATAMDNIAPKIDKNNPQKGFNGMGATVTIAKAFGIDDLSPYYGKNLTVTVTDPSRQIVTSEDGVALSNAPADRDYVIKLTKLGRYQVTYTYADQSIVVGGANQTQEVDTFTVLDNVCPELTIEGDFAGQTEEADYQSTVTVKSYTATDNATEADKLKVRIVVYGPNRESTYLNGEAKTFTASYKGIYTIKYICVDEQGNYAYAEYYVNVE